MYNTDRGSDRMAMLTPPQQFASMVAALAALPAVPLPAHTPQWALYSTHSRLALGVSSLKKTGRARSEPNRYHELTDTDTVRDVER